MPSCEHGGTTSQSAQAKLGTIPATDWRAGMLLCPRANTAMRQHILRGSRTKILGTRPIKGCSIFRKQDGFFDAAYREVPTFGSNAGIIRLAIAPAAGDFRRAMPPPAPIPRSPPADDILPPATGLAVAAEVSPRIAAGQAALATAQTLARQATAAATLRAYKADWTHFSEWCAAHGFLAAPAAPATVGAYLASLAGSHAPTTIRRRLAALGKMHRFNDLAWNPAHHAIQGPLRGVLRTNGRPVQKAAALTLPMLRNILATCDQSARGRRDRALLLFGFAGALRRSELVSLRVEDVAVVAGGLRLRIVRGKTDQAGQGAEIGLPRGTSQKPVRCAHSKPGRRWPNAKPDRYFAKSAPAALLEIPRCIRMRCAAFSPIASAWPGLWWQALIG